MKNNFERESADFFFFFNKAIAHTSALIVVTGENVVQNKYIQSFRKLFGKYQ